MAIESAVLGVDMSEALDRNGHDVGATPLLVPPPAADEVQAQGNQELVSIQSAEASVGDVADADQLRPQGVAREVPRREQALPFQEEEKQCIQELPAAPSMPARAMEPKDSPARTRTRRSKQAVANGQGSGASGRTALDHTTPGVHEDTGEGATSGIPAPHHDEDAVEPAADAARPIGVSAPADHGDSASVDLTRCGWCGGTQFLTMSKELGHIFCECGSVYNPLAGHWAPGRQDKRQSPLAPVSATDSMTVDEIERETSEATATSMAGGGAFGDTVAARQAPPAGPHNAGETHPREGREIA
jgi:hypothetical protein